MWQASAAVRRPFRAFAALVLLLPAPLLAQHTAARRMALDPDGSIRIYNLSGSVRIEGWDRDTLVVSSTQAAGPAEKIFFGGSPRAAKLGIETRQDSQAPVHLVVRVPARARVWVKTADADVTLTGLDGGVDVYTTSGSIRFSGTAGDLHLETMDGNIDAEASGTWIRARTASGNITLRGSGEDVGATTVSGRLVLLSTGLRRARLESVTGAIDFRGTLTRDGDLSVESHSGTVDMRLAADLGTEFDLNTYSGTISGDFPYPVSLLRRGEHGTGLTFTVGDGGAGVTVRTFKGNIVLRRR